MIRRKAAHAAKERERRAAKKAEKEAAKKKAEEDAALRMSEASQNMECIDGLNFLAESASIPSGDAVASAHAAADSGSGRKVTNSKVRTSADARGKNTVATKRSFLASAKSTRVESSGAMRAHQSARGVDSSRSRGAAGATSAAKRPHAGSGNTANATASKSGALSTRPQSHHTAHLMH